MNFAHKFIWNMICETSNWSLVFLFAYSDSMFYMLFIDENILFSYLPLEFFLRSADYLYLKLFVAFLFWFIVLCTNYLYENEDHCKDYCYLTMYRHILHIICWLIFFAFYSKFCFYSSSFTVMFDNRLYTRQAWNCQGYLYFKRESDKHIKFN